MVTESRVGATRLRGHLPLSLLGHLPLAPLPLALALVVVGVHHSEVGQHLLDGVGLMRMMEKSSVEIFSTRILKKPRRIIRGRGTLGMLL